MLDKTQTYCFGRYLVDIPLAAELKGQGNTYYAATINSGRGGSDFTAKVNAALAQRKNESGKHGFKYVKSEFPEGRDRQIIVAKADLWGDSAYSIDAFVRMPSQKKGAGQFFYLSEEGFAGKDIDAIVANYRNILASIRYRSPSEIPTEPGFCIENGFIANDGKTAQVEDASLAFQLKNNPDVWITVSSDVYFKQEKPLLQRIKESGVDKKFPGKGHVVSAQDRVINGMHGQESLDDFPSDDETGVAQSFVWETLGEVATPLKPSIQLNISSGNGIAGQTSPSSLSTKQIQALYESIVKTIRIRPTH
jgi:hypothetical protein